MNATETKIMELLVENLGLEESMLDADVALFGDGPIGLDSIDSLEMIAAIDKEYGVNMTGVAKENFYNIKALAAYVDSNK